MAVTTSYPGVYIDEVSSGVRPIESAGTSTAAFIGKTVKGPVGEPTLIFKWSEYKEQFGVYDGYDAMAFAIYAFFLNGGGAAYIASVEATNYVLEKGIDGNPIQVRVPIQDEDEDGDLLYAADGKTPVYVQAKDEKGELLFEDDGKTPVYEYKLIYEEDGVTPVYEYKYELSKNTYENVFEKLKNIRDISIVCLPGKAWRATIDTTELEKKPVDQLAGDEKAKLSLAGEIAADNGIIDLAVAHADYMKNRIVIVDIGSDVKLTNPGDVDEIVLPRNASGFSVTYYPWLKISDPFFKSDPESKATPEIFSVAPSSFAAGMWAKIDGKRGVWKAPAGVETALLGVAELTDVVDDARQGILNPLGINCIRRIPGAGPVIWGSRTLATKVEPEWRYVPVRRTACMIEESIYNNIQWAVFEPNDHRLWSSLRVNIDAFMNGLWRAGAFQGEKASDAYFVRCNLGDTMTQGDIDTGKVIVEVGFAPLKPAEFVIITIQQKVAQQ